MTTEQGPRKYFPESVIKGIGDRSSFYWQFLAAQSLDFHAGTEDPAYLARANVFALLAAAEATAEATRESSNTWDGIAIDLASIRESLLKIRLAYESGRGE